MGRRKNVKPHPDPKMDQEIVKAGTAADKAALADLSARNHRNAVWYRAYHGLGYTQAMIATLHNAKLGDDAFGRVTEAGVEKALARMD